MDSAGNRADRERREHLLAALETVKLSLSDVRFVTQRILSKYGLAPAHVDALADLIVAAERDECASHGVYRLAGLVRTIKSGKLNLAAEPSVQIDETSIIRVDAQLGFSPLAFKMGQIALAQKAKTHGLAAMAINRCFHFTALWPEVEALAEDGLVSLSLTPSHSWVAPAGGTAPLLGTNPFAFGWPRPNKEPYVFDFATSVVAGGEVELHRQRNHPIPVGWAIDPEGKPTQSAASAMIGTLLTFGGHKGSALSTMIELMAGPLIGDLMSTESLTYDNGVGAAPCHGELVLALSPDVFLGHKKREYFESAERLFSLILAQGARLPSQRRFQARLRSVSDGVTITRIQHDILTDLLEA